MLKREVLHAVCMWWRRESRVEVCSSGSFWHGISAAFLRFASVTSSCGFPVFSLVWYILICFLFANWHRLPWRKLCWWLLTLHSSQWRVLLCFPRFVFQKGVYSIFIWPGTSWFLCWWCIALVNKNLRSLLSLVWYKWLVPFNFSSLHIHRFLLLIFQEEKFYKSKGKLVLFSNSYMYLQILLIRCWSFSLLA